jgi:c-di-GMP-binding flagellar brake protein YcgR
MDRRKYFRFNVELEVQYRQLESLRAHKLTCTENMSERGIRISLPEYFEPGTFLELSIRIPHEAHSITAIGRIIWVKKDSVMQVFTTGMALAHIEETDKALFYKYAFS